MGLLRVIRINQIAQGLDGLFLIRAVGDDGDSRALDDAQGQDAQQALGVDAALFLLDPDAALELVGLLDEEGRGSGMETDLIVDDYLFGYHARHSSLLYRDIQSARI